MSLVPSVELGSEFPSFGLLPVFPLGVPLLNTLLLLSSGVSVTLVHKSLLLRSRFVSFWLLATVLLGVEFLLVQLSEYSSSSFSFSDSASGSLFFLLTGFHGFHVLLGLLLLSFCSLSFSTSSSHVGLTCSIWY